MDSNPPFDWNTTAGLLRRIEAVDPLESAIVTQFLRRLIGYREAVRRSEKRAADVMAKVASGTANEAEVLNTSDEDRVDEAIEPLRAFAEKAAAVYQKRGLNSAPIAQLIKHVGLASDDKCFAGVIASVIPLADAYDETRNGGAKPVDIDDDATLSPKKLAEKWSILPLFGRLQSRLKRWRQENPAGNGTAWIEVADAKPREAKYLFRVGSVRHILDDLKTTGERRAKIILPP